MKREEHEHETFMQAALAEARAALAADEFPVGVVLVHEGEIVAQGRRANSQAATRNELDHAEICALRQLAQTRPDLKLSALTVYSTLEPCLMCYTTLLLSGVRRIVWAYEDVMGGGAGLDLSRLNPLYRDARVELVGGLLRRDALVLFQEFFREHDYWAGSLLARYTLEQSADRDSAAEGETP